VRGGRILKSAIRAFNEGPAKGAKFVVDVETAQDAA
jgi:hypothetical protein